MHFDKELIKDLIESLTGYSVTEKDEAIIDLSIKATVDFVLSYCNRHNLPRRLKSQLYRMIVGEFLYQKITLFGYDALGLSPDVLVSSIKDGDTSTNFATDGTSQNAQIDAFVNNLRRGNLTVLQEFRRLKW